MPFGILPISIATLNEEPVEVLRFDVRGKPGKDEEYIFAQANLRTLSRLQLGCAGSAI
jgi:hypothetical protein